MKILFTQIYIRPGISFPFTHHFQHRLADEITALIAPSAKFIQKYGEDWKLVFNISAKRDITENEIRGPSVYKRTKDVEFTVFLPFDAIHRDSTVAHSAMNFLLGGVCSVLHSLDINVQEIHRQSPDLIENVCSDPTMFESENSKSP